MSTPVTTDHQAEGGRGSFAGGSRAQAVWFFACCLPLSAVLLLHSAKGENVTHDVAQTPPVAVSVSMEATNLAAITRGSGGHGTCAHAEVTAVHLVEEHMKIPHPVFIYIFGHPGKQEATVPAPLPPNLGRHAPRLTSADP